VKGRSAHLSITGSKAFLAFEATFFALECRQDADGKAHFRKDDDAGGFEMTVRRQNLLMLVVAAVVLGVMAVIGIPWIRTERAIRSLAAEDVRARAAAAAYLETSGGDYTVRRLADSVIAARPAGRTRSAVVEILKARGPAVVRPFILALAEDPARIHVTGRRDIVAALREAMRAMPDEAGDETAALAGRPHRDVRMAVAELFGEVRREIAEPPLLKMLDDPCNAVRARAMASLGMRKSVAAAEPLVEILRNDPDGPCRAAAAEAFGQIGDPRAAEALAAALDDTHAAAEAVADLGELMKIPFPPPEEAARFAEAVTTSQASLDPILAAAAAEELSKDPDDVTPDDLKAVKNLDLSATDVGGISALENLTQLKDLSLAGTGVSDISALEKLTALWRLSLSGTRVSDISPLENIKSLKLLDLQGTKVPADDVRKFRETHPNCKVWF